MQDLLKLSEEELAELSARQRLRALMAIGLAFGSSGLALAGMMARFSATDKTPLPGMNHLWGQIGWSAALGVMLILAAWLVRGVIAKRVQWAIAVSLLMHLLLCVSMQTLNVGVPLTPPIQADDKLGEPLEELTLPDYAGMESPDAKAAWQQPSETATPEAEMELERQKSQVNDPNQPTPVEIERPQDVAKVEVAQKEQQVTLKKEAQAELERKMREQETQTPQAVEAPKVNTTKTTQPELDARVEQAKQANAAPSAQKKQADIASTDPRVEAAKLAAKRAESKPQANEQQRVQFNERAAAEAKAAEAAAAESVKVATSDAKQASAQERAVDAARQQAANVPASERSQNDAPVGTRGASVTSVRPDRAAGVGNPSDATPTSGGAAQIARNSGRGVAAADAGAQSVTVGAAAGAGAPKVAESSGATAFTRGSAATVPLGAATQGSGTALQTPQSGAPVRGTSGSVARQATGAGQPQLGKSEGSGLTSGGGGGKQASGAVGAQAAEVSVASAGGNAATQGKVLATGPASTAVGRQSTGLPATSTGTATGLSSPASTGSGTGQPSSVRSTTGSGLAARGTEPTARLDANAGFAAGTTSGLTTARTGTDAKLPTGATDAEQTGTLVFAGPQAQPSAGGKLSGPQMANVPRRSAGLPGSSGPESTGAPATSGATQPTRIAGGPARPGVGDDRPKLATDSQVAGLIKKSVPGIGASPEAKISASLSMRKTESRREATKTLGGSEASEVAVERGLAWLAQHQHPDGHWSIHEFRCQDHQCTGHGSFHSDTAATGLALLAFLGAGYTHQSGQHQAVIERAVKWHLQHQKPDGDLFADESDFVWFYSHGMASIALCEAFGLTKDPALREPTQKALNFIIESQHPEFGGWRYRPKFESDTSVSGWQLMALKSGEMAGLKVPKTAYAGVAKWLDTVESKSAAGQFAYHPSKPASLAMSAEGLLMRQYLGAKRNDARLIAGAEYLRKHLPDLNDRDAYFWYYGTQVMFHMQGEYWDEWNAGLRDMLVNGQLKDGGSSGSWNSDRPTPEKWGAAGGRHYVTCLNLLMLEVYYRHLPLYIELGK